MPRSGVLRDVLPNGIRCYSFPHDNFNVSGIGFKVGSINDPCNQRGMAHLTEHVLFRESDKYPSRATDIILRQFMGGPDDDINVRTDYVSTFYGHDDLRMRRYMFKSFDVLASIVQDRILNIEGLDIEKSAVLQEYYLRGIDEPITYSDDLLLQTIYDVNPIRNRIDCEPDELRAIQLSDVRHFVRRYYVPKNMFVIMFGPKREVVNGLVRKYFGDLSHTSKPILDYDHRDDFPKLTSVKSLEMPSPGLHQSHVQIGFPTEVYGSGDSETLDMLADLLEMHLFWRLREENRNLGSGVYRVVCEAMRTYVHGLFSIWFATSSTDFAAEAEARIIKEVKWFCENLVPADEFDAIRTRQISGYRSAFTDYPGILCEMVIESVCNGDEKLEKLHNYPQRLHSVTRRKIREVANKYLSLPYGRVVLQPI